MTHNFLSIFLQLLKGKSLPRALFNVALSGLHPWQGMVLDIGGIKKPAPSYLRWIQLDSGMQLTTLNIDVNADPDIVASADQMPVQDQSFDGAWCLNVLEHLAHPSRALAEAFRILKPGGRILIITPFLVRVHGHPDDYFRYTSSGLRLLLEGEGFVIERLDCIGGTPCIAALSQVQTVLPRIVTVVLYPSCVVMDAIIRKMRPNISETWPLSYLVEARRV